MFFDPQCKPEVSPVTRPDIYALPTLIAWLEKQPAGKTYDFCNCRGECLLDQYLDAHGIPWSVGGPAYCELTDKVDGNWQSIASECPQTFGAALERARALL